MRIDRVLMISDEDEVTVGSPLVDSQVNATVLSHGKLRKIKVFKMKRRKNYRRTQGHRQSYTEIELPGLVTTSWRQQLDLKSNRSHQNQP